MKISITFKDLKDIGVVVPIISPFNLPIWPLQKLDRSWRVTVDYQKLNQIVAVITETVARGDLV